MKPKTKYQKEVVLAASMLKPLTEKQKQYAFQNCFSPVIKVNKKNICTCTECAGTWKAKLELSKKTEKCPFCGRDLEIDRTRKKLYRGIEYFSVITTCNGLQVIRFFNVTAEFRVGERAKYDIAEVVQRWISPQGKTETLARTRLASIFYYDVWNLGSDMEIRKASREYIYNINAYVTYPYIRVLDILKRNGFKGDFFGIKPYDMFTAILTDSKMETLLKSGNIELFRYFLTHNISNYWSSLKICLRNGYKIHQPDIWCDYIDLLLYFGRDIRNRKLICVENLIENHNLLANKKAIKERKKQENEARKEAIKNEKNYLKSKSKFFGLVFSKGNIQIRVLQSVQEFIEEADFMHHCVFSNEYFKKENSLILSAEVDGVKQETIEVSLINMEIIQSRGKYNKATEYHNDIVNIINDNMFQIKNCMIA